MKDAIMYKGLEYKQHPDWADDVWLHPLCWECQNEPCPLGHYCCVCEDPGLSKKFLPESEKPGHGDSDD